MKLITTPLIAGIVLLLLACTKKKTSTSERFYFRHDGADLAVQIDGNTASKIFILVLHGGPGGGSAAYNSGYYADKLEERYAMVYLDQRGNGASQGKFSESDLTLSQNSKDIYALTRFLKQKYGKAISVFLMGHSWGGLTGTHALLTTNLQSELKGWIEVDGAHDFPLNDVESVKLFLKIGKSELAAGNNSDFWQPIVDKVSQIDTTAISSADQNYLNDNGFKAEAKLTEVKSDGDKGSGAPFGIANSPDVSLTVYLSNQAVNPILNKESQATPLTSQLNKIAIPCQFLWGKYDFVVPPALGYSAYNLVNTSKKEFVLFNHSGHSPMSNEPELFVKEVVDFIELYK
jgi:pimeloyl-ACP methyl ester carboxylesterase